MDYLVSQKSFYFVLNNLLSNISASNRYLLVYLDFKSNVYQGEKVEKKLPHRPYDLPHRLLVLCSNLPDDHCHFYEL